MGTPITRSDRRNAAIAEASRYCADLSAPIVALNAAGFGSVADAVALEGTRLYEYLVARAETEAREGDSAPESLTHYVRSLHSLSGEARRLTEVLR